MLKTPIDAREIRVRLHWANSIDELADEINSSLEAYADNAIYGMDYRLAMVPGDDDKLREKHLMVVYFRP